MVLKPIISFYPKSTYSILRSLKWYTVVLTPYGHICACKDCTANEDMKNCPSVELEWNNKANENFFAKRFINHETFYSTVKNNS